MNITLILGNGFDLNMGLPTAYSDFYQYYLKLETPSSTDIITKKIKEEPETWADLERMMGEVSAEYFQDSKVYVEAYENVRDQLATYLKEVDKIVIPNLENHTIRFFTDILKIGTYLDNKPKREYRNFLLGLDTSKINLSIVNFNYTSTIEKMMNLHDSYEKDKQKIVFKQIEHVHQNLNNGILMGVNDKSQIKNEQFRELFDVRSLMVKPFINQEFAADNDTRSFDAIDNSNVIILFGTSLGVTDEIWWSFIGANVFSKNKRIIYCPHEKGDNAPLNATDLIRKNHKFKTELAARLSGDNSEQQTLYNKIYPIRNNHLFNFGNNSAYRIRVRSEVISTLLANK